MYRMAGMHCSLQTFRAQPGNPIGMIIPSINRVNGSVIAAGTALPSSHTAPPAAPYRASALAQAVAAANRRGSTEYYGLDGVQIVEDAAPPSSSAAPSSTASSSNGSSSSRAAKDDFTRPSPTFVHR